MRDLDPNTVSYYDYYVKRIMQGRKVEESQVDEWVAEAEVGYDVGQLRARWGRAPRGAAAAQVVPVRLTTDELAAVMVRAEREGLNRSEAIRAALEAWAHVA
jgi:Ribbon-helix-helix protein, copG family